MSTKREFGKYVFNGSAALLLALSMMPLTDAAGAEPFSGDATLCAVFINDSEPKGNKGVEYSYNNTYIYLITADEPLMIGWEVQSNNINPAINHIC